MDEDALLAAAYEGRITDAELKALYDESENYAFYLVEKGQEQDEDEDT